MISPTSGIMTNVWRLYKAMGWPIISRYCFGMGACAKAPRRQAAASDPAFGCCVRCVPAAETVSNCCWGRHDTHSHPLADAPGEQDDADGSWCNCVCGRCRDGCESGREAALCAELFCCRPATLCLTAAVTSRRDELTGAV